MGEYMWGVSREFETRKISAAKVKRIDAIAQQAGGDDCGFTYYIQDEYSPPRPKWWFFAPNLGEPFDRATQKAVEAALAAAGVVIP